jgi:hypothetical protein
MSGGADDSVAVHVCLAFRTAPIEESLSHAAHVLKLADD